MMQKANRKSHLQAPLSPATQALLKSDGPFSGGTPDIKDNKTPTSGEIPIATSAGTSVSGHHVEPVSRTMSSENVNGRTSNGYSQYLQDPQPGFPPRTSSSTSVLPTRLKEPGERNSFATSSVMPIRPAPAPGLRPESRGSMTNRRYMQQGEGQMI